MRKEESAESASPSVSFPAGICSLAIEREEEDPVYIRLNIIGAQCDSPTILRPWEISRDCHGHPNHFTAPLDNPSK